MVGAHLFANNNGQFSPSLSHVTNIPNNAIITEFDGKEIGMMNNQYKNWDIDIFYSDSNSIPVKYITSTSNGTTNLPIRDRTIDEDAEFEELSKKKPLPF